MIQARNIDFTTLGGNYSTSEIDTGYTWLNGEPIYKKTLVFGSMPNNTTTTYSFGVSNANVIKHELRWFDTEDNRWFTESRFDSASTRIAYEGYGTDKVRIKAVGTNWASRTNNASITLYYCK